MIKSTIKETDDYDEMKPVISRKRKQTKYCQKTRTKNMKKKERG